MQAHAMSNAQLIPAAIEAFWGTIPPVWNRIKGNIRSMALEQYDISVEQFHILRHIRKGLTSVSELAQVKQISRSAISQAVDLLVEKGLVTRQQDKHDRRFVQLDLTDNGTILLTAIFGKNHLWMVEKMTALRPDELETIISAMVILKSTFVSPEI
jgi:DNA-binding MarR family transcriptional regulator